FPETWENLSLRRLDMLARSQAPKPSKSHLFSGSSVGGALACGRQKIAVPSIARLDMGLAPQICKPDRKPAFADLPAIRRATGAINDEVRLMERADKTARELYDALRARPPPARFAFGRKPALINVDLQYAYTRPSEFV